MLFILKAKYGCSCCFCFVDAVKLSVQYVIKMYLNNVNQMVEVAKQEAAQKEAVKKAEEVVQRERGAKHTKEYMNSMKNLAIRWRGGNT